MHQCIFGKKVVVLQDLRSSTFSLPWDHLLAWFEGETFRVPLPQNHHQGDGIYTEAAPIFASGSDRLRIDRYEAAMYQEGHRVQNEMMDTRWVYFYFPVSMPPNLEVRPCGRCFAEWLVTEDLPGALAASQERFEPGSNSQPGEADVAEALECIRDWMETHGAIKLGPPPGGNVGAASDALAWPQRFVGRCGRLVPFLHARCIVDAEGVVTMRHSE